MLVNSPQTPYLEADGNVFFDTIKYNLCQILFRNEEKNIICQILFRSEEKMDLPYLIKYLFTVLFAFPSIIFRMHQYT